MPTITVAAFAGAIPRTAPRLLENQNASDCVNCTMDSGALRALRGPGNVCDLPGPAATIFKHDTDGWLHWAGNVNVVKSAVLDADEEKPLGQLLITGDREYPTMYLAGGAIYRLGIPRPEVAPHVKVKAEAALEDVDAWAFAVSGIEDAPARYGYEGTAIRAAEGTRLTFYSSRTLRDAGSAAGDTGIAIMATGMSLAVVRDGNMVEVAVTGAAPGSLTFAYQVQGMWSMAGDVTTLDDTHFTFQIPEAATLLRVWDTSGQNAIAEIPANDPPAGGDGDAGDAGDTGDGAEEDAPGEGGSDQVAEPEFDRSATLEAKALQLNATAFEGRTNWTALEVPQFIYAAGFESVEEWWEKFGDDEGICPWDAPERCRQAGYTYYAGMEEPGISRSSSYCYTVVQSLAGGVIQYESAPSPPSIVLDVPDGDGVVVSGFSIPSRPELKITHIRIYRTVSGESSSEFRFLAELTLDELEALGWQYTDTIHDKDVSTEVLQTSTWDPIPDNARGLIKTDNGIYAAFRGNELLISEPFVPYAFPAAYRLTVEDSIVALAHVDNTIVVLTTGRPYLAQGSVPESLALTHLPIEQACVSARSVATLPGGVLYASPDGLMLFSSNQQALATDQTYSREQWQALGPERLMGAVHDNRYIGFFEGTNRGLLFHIGRADVTRLELPEGWKVRALYHHSEDDALYLSVERGNGSNGIWRFEADGADPLPYRWHSKTFFFSALCAMAAARVQGEMGPGNPVKMDIFGPDSIRQRESLFLTGDKAVRIRPTRAERVWSFCLSGTADVYEARLGGSVEGLENGI